MGGVLLAGPESASLKTDWANLTCTVLLRNAMQEYSSLSFMASPDCEVQNGNGRAFPRKANTANSFAEETSSEDVRFRLCREVHSTLIRKDLKNAGSIRG
ncbi:hypothetical protein FOCC_FOCC005108 [Frankliniella occidentalis]|nr:hypothetical protein FOCC_FOCC005108 [Frankliniella occidentalis]